VDLNRRSPGGLGAPDGAPGIGGAAPSPTTVMVCTVVALVAGLALQLLSAHFGHMYGDIEMLFRARGIRPHELPYLDRPLEYPVVIGFLMWATSWVGHTQATFFLANAAVIAALVLATTYLLAQRNPDRVLRFALAPTLVWYSFHNFDMVPVFCTVAGLVALERRRPATAGALLAVGAWAKLYPALFLPAFLLLLWRSDRTAAKRFAAGTVAVTVVVNLPIMLGSWQGWWHPIEFQGVRQATWGSLWYHLLRLPGVGHLVSTASGPTNVLAAVALLAGLVLVTRRSVRLRLGPAQIAGAMTAVFVLTNKVYSPQYSLWVLPFFVLLALPRRLWVGFIVADAAMYLLVFGPWLRDHAQGDLRITLIAVVVVVRAVILLDVIRRSMQAPAAPVAPAEPAGPDEPVEVVGPRARSALW
jgi:uncharacterized membrane protein